MLEWLFPLYSTCLACGREDRFSRTRGFCEACHKALPVCEKEHAVFWYRPPIDGLIQDLKYHNKRYLARIFGPYVKKRLELMTYDDLVFVPLHRDKQKRRGYNQAELLARVADPKRTRGLLVRVKNTDTQTRMTAKERRENVKGAFALAPGVSAAGRDMVVLDDVLTTGSTLAACRETLLAAGAKKVSCLALAAAPLLS